MGAKGLRDYAKNDYGVTLTTDEATRFREAFFQTYSGLRRWQRKANEEAVHAESTRTVSGRSGSERSPSKRTRPTRKPGCSWASANIRSAVSA